MPLILAIEPDRRQANQVNAVVRGRLHAELVLADTAERALAALGNRVPDLILTAMLLSPNDESVLAEGLRALGDAGAHIQTLTIPVLASRSQSEEESGGGMLSALRRKAKASTPDGCDPAVFAQQCSEYLERARAERIAYSRQAHGADDHDHHHDHGHDHQHEHQAAHAPVVNPPPSIPARQSEPDAVISEFTAALTEEPPTREMVTPVEPVAHAAAPAVTPREEERVEPVAPVFIDTKGAAATVQEAVARLQALVDVDDLPAPAPSVEFDLSTILTPPEAEKPEPAPAAAIVESREEPDIYDISDFDAAAFLEAADVKPAASSRRSKPAEPVKEKAPAPAEPVWPDIEEMVAESTAAPATPAPAQPRPRPTLSGKRAQAAKAKPVQDEWGFFDPEQCGFAALLAKLDEIVEDDTPSDTAATTPAPRPKTRRA